MQKLQDTLYLTHTITLNKVRDQYGKQYLFKWKIRNNTESFTRGGMKCGTPMDQVVYSHDSRDVFSIYRILYAVPNAAVVYQTDGRQRNAGRSGDGRVYADCRYFSPVRRRSAGPVRQASVYPLGAASLCRGDVYV